MHLKNYVTGLDHCIRACLYFYVFSFPLSIAAGNLFIDIAILLALFRMGLQRDDLQWDRKILFFLFVYSSVLLFSALGADHYAAGFRQAGSAIYYMAPPFILAHLFVAPQKRFYYLGLMMVSILFSALLAYVQALGGVVRSSGFIAPLELAGNVSLLLPVAVLLVCESANPKNTRQVHGLSLLAFFLFAGALILTGTRGAWLAVGFTLLLYFCHFVLAHRGSWRKIALFSLLVILIVSALSFLPAAQQRIASLTNRNDYSVVTRFAMWQSASRMWADHPLFGVGLSNYHQRYTTQYFDPEPWERFGQNHDGLTHKHPHNIYLYLLAETGIMGLSAFAGLIGYVFWHFVSVGRNASTATTFFAKMAILLLLTYLAFGMTENLVFGMFPTLQSLWFLLGMLWNPCYHCFFGGKRP